MPFDILHLRDQNFAASRCASCGYLRMPDEAVGGCTVCGSLSFKASGTLRSRDEFLRQANELAEVVHRYEGEAWPPYRLLLELLSRAEWFVHFATFGMSSDLLAVFKFASIRVPVAGWVSKAGNAIRQEVEDWPDEAPQLRARCVAQDQNGDMPHQKLVVVDGMIAIEGSANLTQAAYRKARADWEVVSAVTQVERVVALNNRYFAPTWATLNEPRMVEGTNPVTEIELPSLVATADADAVAREALKLLRPLPRALLSSPTYSFLEDGTLVCTAPSEVHAQKCRTHQRTLENALAIVCKRYVPVLILSAHADF